MCGDVRAHVTRALIGVCVLVVLTGGCEGDEKKSGSTQPAASATPAEACERMEALKARADVETSPEGGHDACVRALEMVANACGDAGADMLECLVGAADGDAIDACLEPCEERVRSMAEVDVARVAALIDPTTASEPRQALIEMGDRVVPTLMAAAQKAMPRYESADADGRREQGKTFDEITQICAEVGTACAPVIEWVASNAPDAALRNEQCEQLASWNLECPDPEDDGIEGDD